MKRKPFLHLLAFLFLALWAGEAKGQSSPFSDAIRNRLEAGRSRGEWTASGETILAVRALPQVYDQRGFSGIWIHDGRPTSEALEFMEALRSGEEEGLRPEDYHLQAIDSLLTLRTGSGPGDLRRQVDLEFLLSDAFLVFGSHLLQGRVNPVTINPEWLANRRNVDMSAVLLAAAASGSFADALRDLLPRHSGYSALKEALAALRKASASGGWALLPEGPTFREGESDLRVPALRVRLMISGDLPSGRDRSQAAGDSVYFDTSLGDAVRRFQGRHGLEADGAVGRATLAALNVPVSDRIRQLEVNLERWRWLPEDLGSRYLLGNIAGFSVTVVEGEVPVLEMRAIVGREYRQTPVFSARMTYLVLSPYWHVPPTIAAVDKLPEIKKDPGYVAAQRMTLLDAASNLPVDPASVDWISMTGAEFNRQYRLRQDPGPLNALGDVKFMFPNPHNVYLHDTPSRELFARAERGFSSGCIRIERPLDLAEYLLRSDERWTRDEIARVIEQRREVTVTLSDPIPVHIEYWTAWVDRDGVLNFRRDLYGRDAVVAEALAASAPGM